LIAFAPDPASLHPVVHVCFLRSLLRHWQLLLVSVGSIPGAEGAPPVVVGELPAAVHEGSGLAVSRRDPGLLWTHNDHGALPLLYAIDHAGGLRGTIRVIGAGANDWEDISTFELDGQAWILVADTGDNHQRRANAVLYLLAEPAPDRLSPEAVLDVPIQARLPVRFPDGPVDCEAMAVDPHRREILLISKRTSPPVVYRLPLILESTAAASVPVAEAIQSLSLLPAAPWWQFFNFGTGGWLRAWPTGLDILSDGRSAAVLTYGEPYVFKRAEEEDWAAAFAKQPERLAPHGLAQAEGISFSADGRHLFVITEGRPAPLVRYELDRSGADFDDPKPEDPPADSFPSR
jgi:hypothetical protein